MVFARWTPVLVVAAVCVAQVIADDTPHCNITVSAGNAANGLKVVTDPRCATSGNGCIDTLCRHCIATPPSTDYPTYPNCSDIVDVEETNEDDGSADTDDSSQADDGSGATEHDLPDNLEAESPVSGASYGCPYPTSGGDFDVGIQLVGDATCNQGGLGCFANVCRFCKFKETNQSSHLFTCDSLGYTIHVPVVETVLPPANPDTGCPFNVSSGDFAVGVQLVGDLSCINGGIGCYQDICRFCKFQETPQSANWRNCSDFGYPHTPAPTFAPTSIDDNGVWDGSTGCAYAVSSGDFAVGVQLVGDTSCASGGLGCFGNTCRFCQFRPTLQSQHMVSCASLGYPRSQQPIGTPQDIADPITGCPFPVSSGDFAAGIQLVGDTSCTKGGLGCYNNVCRFCKFKETPQSTNWVPCANYSYPPVAPPVIQVANIEPSVDYGTGCPYPVTSGDYNVGIQLVGDDSCVKGGIGCYKDVCRFCKFQNTNQSAAFVDCSTLGWPRTVTPVAKPADIPVENPATGCPYPVSSGDFAVGIQLVGDASCVKGGLGCYKNVCRFCKFHETVQSSGFVACEDLGYGAIFTPATVDTNTTSTNCPYPVSSGDYDAGIHLVGDTSCSEGGVGCYKDVCRFCKFRDSPQSGAFVNCEDLGYFFGSNADAILPAPPSSGPSTQCPYPTSIGDLAVGVLLVGDAKCATGGIGCFKNVCRYCQFVPTDKSNNFVTCTSLGYNYSIPAMPMKPAPTTPPTLPPTTTPPPPPPTTAAPTLPVCPYAVSPGDFAVGINLVGDPTCAAGGIGCYQNVCRFCKFNETVQAANFVPCANYSQVVAAPAEIVVTTPPLTTAAPPKPPVCAKVCDLPLAPGDRNVGVGLVTDYSCLISGLGCIKDSVCRFCRVTRTAKSNHLNPCSKYGSFGTAVTQPPKTQAPTVTPTTQPPAIAVVPTVDPGTTPVATASTVVPGATPPALVVTPAVLPASATASDSTVVPPLPATSNASDTGAASVVPAVAPVVPGVAPANPTAPVSGTVSDSAVPPPAQGSAPAVVPSAPMTGTAIDPAGAPASPASATTSDSGTVLLNPVVPATGTATDPAGAPASPASATTSDSGAVPVNPVVSSAGTTSDSAVVPAVAGPAPASIPAMVPSSPASATASDSAPAPVVPVGSSTDPVVAPVVVAPPLRLAMKEKTTSFTETMNKLFEDDIFKWSASAAACVGVVAIVAVMAIGTKRLVTHRRQSVATIEDEEASTQEELDIPTKTKSPIDEEEKV